MTDTGRVAHDGNLRVIHDVRDEGIGATRNQEINVSFALQELIYLLVRFCKRKHLLIEACLCKRSLDKGEERPVRALCLLAALEDCGIAALYAQRPDLDQGIGTCLEDDADDADGAAHAAKHEPLIELARKLGHTDRVAQLLER